MGKVVKKQKRGSTGKIGAKEKDKSRVKDHKKELELLKTQDPEFYEYLKENDKKLLEFGNDEDDGEDEFSSSEGEDGSESEIQSDDELMETEEQDTVVDISRAADMTNTLALIKQEIIEKKSFKAVKKLVKVLATFVSNGDDEENITNLAFSDEEISQSLLSIACEDVPDLFIKFFGKKINVASKSWIRNAPIVKGWLRQLLAVIKSLSHDFMIDYVLNSLQKHNISPIIAALPRTAVSKEWLKMLIDYWTKIKKSDDEDEEKEFSIPTINVNAFMIIKALLESNDKWITKRCLKSCYKAFIQRSKRSNSTFLKHLQFLANCMVELFKVDTQEAYQHAFISIRYVAMLVRKAITTHKTKDGVSVIASWEIINRICFWCKAFGEIEDDGYLRKLIFPLTQTVFSLMPLVKGSHLYPFSLHLLNGLHQLSASTGVYIPISSYLLDILSEVSKPQKLKPSTLKPFSWDVNFRVSQQYLSTRVYVDDVIQQVCNVIIKHLAAFCSVISAPEFTVMIMIRLKGILKSNKNPKLTPLVKGLVEKIKQNSEFVVAERLKTSLAPCQLEKIADFKTGTTPLQKYQASAEYIEKQKKMIKQ